jgi:hypothetical protein
MGEITFIRDLSTIFLCGPSFVMTRFVAVPKKENHAHDTFVVIDSYKNKAVRSLSSLCSAGSRFLSMLLEGRGGMEPNSNERK